MESFPEHPVLPWRHRTCCRCRYSPLWWINLVLANSADRML